MVLAIPLSFLHVILVILAAQATPTPPAGTAAIPPIVWELVSYTEAGGDPVEVADPSRYTVQFLENGDLAAGLDCNRGHGSYTAADGVLSLAELAATRMLCAEDSLDAQFTSILSDATAYAVDEDGFLVLSGDAGELRLRPAVDEAA